MAEPMFGEMPLIAPVFLQTDQIDSSITVVTPSRFAVQGTVTLRDQAGEIVGSEVVAFPSHSSTVLAMKTILAATGSQAHSGSVTIVQDPKVKGPALLAQLSMSLHTGSQSAFLEEEFGMPTAHGSALLQGVASQTLNLPLLAVTSVSDVPQTIQATCVGENKVASAIELPARATAVVQACSWQPVPDLALNLSSSLLAKSGAVESDHAISLKSDSVPGSFYAFGLALNGGLDQAQLQPLDFVDPGTLLSNGTVYVGVPTGDGTLLPAALSAPVLSLANFSDEPRQTSVLWSDSSSGKPKVLQVASVTVPPLSTQNLALSSVTGSGILNTFTITSNGKAGDVQAHLFTRVGSSKQRVELLSKNAGDDHNGGDHPWSLANGDRSTLLLYNNSDKTLPFHVRISEATSSWVESFSLAPSETRSVSINDIVGSQRPDHLKKVLSANARQGEVQWNTEFGGVGFGRLLVTNSATSLARNFSCTMYYNFCAASFGANNFSDVLLDGSSVNLSEIQPTFCTEYSPYSCSQSAPAGYSPAYSFNTAWTSSNNISHVSSSNTYLGVQGNSLGSYSVTAVTSAGSCSSAPMGGGGNVVSVSSSPSSISMSNGDSSVKLNVSVNPTSATSGESVTATKQLNQSSASDATLSFTAPGSFSGNNDAFTIKVSGSNSPSGIFAAKACVSAGCSSNPTTITIPPQVIIQVLYGEAHGQAATGDNTSEPAIASSIALRLNNPDFGNPSTWQAVITPQQFNGISTSITTGQEPELDVAVGAFNGSLQDSTNGSPCFFSPTASGFAAIQAAYNANATTPPSVSADPLCYGSNRQFVWKTSIGKNASTGSGAPAFIFERRKVGSAAVVQIP